MMKGKTGWKQKLRHELVNYWLIVLYLAVFFGVFTTYRRLILAQYQIHYADYGIAAIKALVLAKVVLVAETLRLGRGFEDKPLFVPTLYKAFLFTVCLVLFSGAEDLIRSLVGEKGASGHVAAIINQFTSERLAGILVVFFAFIPFFAVRELKRILGEGALTKLFFKRRT